MSGESSGRADPAVVFGLGSGRCGTTTLSGLLDAQPASHAGHERPGHELAWSGGEKALDGVLDWCASDPSLRLVGDVGFYYLPYVDRICARFPQARFVCIRRDREETIQSYVKKAAGRNHWIEHDGRRWVPDRWDHCYPKFDADSLEQALGMYWDAYYGRAERIAAAAPDRLRIFPIESLNSEAGQHEILDFVGVPQRGRVVDTGLRLNDEATTLRPSHSPLRAWIKRLKWRRRRAGRDRG